MIVCFSVIRSSASPAGWRSLRVAGCVRLAGRPPVARVRSCAVRGRPARQPRACVARPQRGSTALCTPSSTDALGRRESAGKRLPKVHIHMKKGLVLKCSVERLCESHSRAQRCVGLSSTGLQLTRKRERTLIIAHGDHLPTAALNPPPWGLATYSAVVEKLVARRRRWRRRRPFGHAQISRLRVGEMPQGSQEALLQEWWELSQACMRAAGKLSGLDRTPSQHSTRFTRPWSRSTTFTRQRTLSSPTGIPTQRARAPCRRRRSSR